MSASGLRRLAWAFAGLLTFLWIGYEDRGTAAVWLVSATLCTAAGLHLLAGWLTGHAPGSPARLLRFTAGGSAVGLAIGPAAAALMVIKLSLHAHPVPDFTLAEIQQVLRSTLLRAGQGAALGLAGGGIWLLRQRR